MEIAADNIDKLINIEMRRTGLPRGKKWVLWEVARELSPEPLVLAAASVVSTEARSAERRDLVSAIWRLIVETRSLHSGLRPSVETTKTLGLYDASR